MSFEAIEWFRNMNCQSRTTFIHFNIIEFYSFISKDLLLKGLNHVKYFIDISKEPIEIIFIRRKSILTDKSTWNHSINKGNFAYGVRRTVDNCTFFLEIIKDCQHDLLYWMLCLEFFLN